MTKNRFTGNLIEISSKPYFILSLGIFWTIIVIVLLSLHLFFPNIEINNVPFVLILIWLIVIIGLFISYFIFSKRQTQKKLIEKELIDSQERYFSLFQNMTEGFALMEIILDEKGNPVNFLFLEINPTFEKLTGLSKTDLTGKTALDINSTIDDFWIKKYSDVALTGKPDKFQYFSKYIQKNMEIIIYSPKKNQFATILTDITERKKYIDELLIKEQAISSSINALALSDLEGKINYINDAFLKLWEIKDNNEVLGKSLHDFFTDENEVRIIIKDVLLSGSKIGELNAKNGNGKIFDILFTLTLVKDVEGLPLNLVASFIDITEKKIVEKKLMQSDRIFEHSLEMICIAGFDGYFKIINPAWTKILGWSHEEMLSKPWIDFVHPDDKTATDNIKKVIIGGKEIISFENRYICKDGSYKWLSWNNFPYTEENLIYAVARDVTERKAIETALLKAEKMFRAIIENAPEGVVLLGKEGKLIYGSPSALKMFGYSSSDFIGDINPNESTHPDDLPIVLETLKNVFQNPDEIQRLEYRFRKKNGEWYWIESIFSNQLNEPGVEAIVINFRNTDKKKKALEALKDRESLLSTLIGNAPFEIWARDANEIGILENIHLVKNFGSILGKNLDESGQPKNVIKLLRENNKRVLNGDIVNEEVAYKVGGKLITYQNILAPIFVDNVYHGIAGFNIDITERKYAEMIQKAQYEIAKSVISTNDMAVLFKSVQNELSNLMYANNMFIAMYNAKTNILTAEYNADDFDDIKTWTAYKSLTGYLIEQKKALILHKNEISGLIENGEINLVGTSPEIWIGAPLYSKNEVIGAIVLQSYDDPDAYNFKSVEILEIIANQLSSYIERKSAEEELIKSIRHLEAVVHNMPMMLFALDSQGVFTLSEGKGLEELGVKPGEVVGKSVFEIYGKISDYVNAIAKSLRGESVYFINNEYNLWFETWLLPVFDNFNQVSGVIGVSMNITERKKAEESLNISNKTYKGIFDTISEFLFIMDENSFFIDFNDVVCHKFGFTREELLGKNHEYISAPGMNDLELVEIMFDKALNGTPQRFEFWGMKKNGEMFPNEVVFNQGYYFGQKVVIAVARDISERKEAENELLIAKERAEESDMLKSAFLANMSHEIRTPMNAILGFSHLLEANNLAPEEKKEFIHIIHKRGHDLLNIINDILDISKIEANQLSIYHAPCDVNELLDEILGIYSTVDKYSEKSKITLSIGNKIPNLPNISTDISRLQQVLTNLINNALKFTEKGSIEFGYHLSKSKFLIFYVNDTGIGIPEKKKNLIFERFRQSEDNHLNRQFDGAGLGLSICKGLLELMGGKIWVESEENKGSTFYFNIPYKPIANEETTYYHPNDFNVSWEDKKILIIEDDSLNTRLITKLLEYTKVKCILAENAQTALEIFRRNQEFDLILLDIQLPDMSGYELAGLLLQMSPYSKIIAQTANAFSEDRRKAIAAGCCDYISKPLNRDHLLSLINKYLQKT